MPRGRTIGFKGSHASSKFHGVSLTSARTGNAASIRSVDARPWRTNIELNDGKMWRKSFATEREAAIAYDRYVLEHKLDRPLNILKPKP